ncbi:hypothetical protein K443DRAFT_443362 [Laccaria amethystina LaAM-08-1]|jgi:hypothetical protein|uniref:DUF6699 domain-containing protein n=1 Tax=Laccaria amethystina LaAM-08-1 TaxID=1095629 RepID=A0A0C9WWL1_9AGAR|nr:hypothetical protein K443DRAFT_443362 [Laccaria amethystina LaAM-08-1]
MGDSAVSKWAPGNSYGPVLSQTDLYLLGTELEINPILANKHNFHLVFNLVTGQTGGFNNNARDRDLTFTAKDEPATLPRVAQLMIITEISPWCTIIKNERGVTMGDVCTMIWKDYTEHYVSDAEFGALPPRLQEQVKRTAMNNLSQAAGWPQQMYYAPQAPPNRYKRVDWLRERIFFEGLKLNDQYTTSRLGFKAPNVFVMSLAP